MLFYQQAASRLMKGVVGHHNSSVDRIYSKEMFMLQFAHIFGEETLLSTTDFNVLLTYLSRDRNIVLYDGKVFICITLLSLYIVGIVDRCADREI